MGLKKLDIPTTELRTLLNVNPKFSRMLAQAYVQAFAGKDWPPTGSRFVFSGVDVDWVDQRFVGNNRGEGGESSFLFGFGGVG